MESVDSFRSALKTFLLRRLFVYRRDTLRPCSDLATLRRIRTCHIAVTITTDPLNLLTQIYWQSKSWTRLKASQGHCTGVHCSMATIWRQYYTDWSVVVSTGQHKPSSVNTLTIYEISAKRSYSFTRVCVCHKMSVDRDESLKYVCLAAIHWDKLIAETSSSTDVTSTSSNTQSQLEEILSITNIQ